MLVYPKCQFSCFIGKEVKVWTQRDQVAFCHPVSA